MNLWPMIVERIERDPGVLDEALGVLDRWDARGIGPACRRREWRQLLVAAKTNRAGLQALLRLLADQGEPARRLKDFAPFAGVLSREERRREFLQCSYDH